MPEYIAPPAALPPGSRVWAYLRDSGGDAQEQSVAQQEAEIRGYCQRYGLVLTHVFKDVAKSGKSAAGRSAFMDMIEQAERGADKAAGVLVWNFARFARNMKEAIYHDARLDMRGVVVHSLTDPIPSGPFGTLVKDLIHFANQEKREQTSRDVKRGLQNYFRQGYSFGVPPVGYIAVQERVGTKRNGAPRLASRWQPDPERAHLVTLAWELRAAGRTYSEISERTEGKLYKSKNCWATFYSNKAYLGVGMWGELEVPNHHPALVDQATWDAVQLHQGKRGPQQIARSGRSALLTGLVYCAECGAAMLQDRDGHGWRYYICGKKDREGWDACPNKSYSAARLESIVLDNVLAKILTPEYVASVLDEAQRILAAPDLAALETEQRSLEQQQADIAARIEALLDLAEINGAAAVLARLHSRQVEQAEIAAAMQTIVSRRTAANAKLDVDVLAIVLDAWRAELRNTRKANDLHALHVLLGHIVRRIEVGYNRVVIIYEQDSTSALSATTGNPHPNPLGHTSGNRRALIISWSD